MQMGPLIDQELEKIDKRHAALTGANKQLMDAMNLYHSLMKDSFPMSTYYSGFSASYMPSTQPYQAPPTMTSSHQTEPPAQMFGQMSISGPLQQPPPGIPVSSGPLQTQIHNVPGVSTAAAFVPPASYGPPSMTTNGNPQIAYRYGPPQVPAGIAYTGSPIRQPLPQQQPHFQPPQSQDQQPQFTNYTHPGQPGYMPQGQPVNNIQYETINPVLNQYNPY